MLIESKYSSEKVLLDKSTIAVFETKEDASVRLRNMNNHMLFKETDTHCTEVFSNNTKVTNVDGSYLIYEVQEAPYRKSLPILNTSTNFETDEEGVLRFSKVSDLFIISTEDLETVFEEQMNEADLEIIKNSFTQEDMIRSFKSRFDCDWYDHAEAFVRSALEKSKETIVN